MGQSQKLNIQPRSRSPLVQLAGIRKSFDGKTVIDNLNLTINNGEFLTLLGPSGCGKTTVLRLIAGLENVDSGRIHLEDHDITHIPAENRHVNTVFQSYALFPHMTVEQNIAFGLKQDKMAKGEINARVEEMLRLVQMSKFAKRKPHQLSGGQQQRVALARSLAKRPKILLLDEPLGALDKKLRQQTQLELVNTLEQVGVTCIMVTHDQEEAMTMATRVAIMSEGQLQQVGTPSDVYDFPNSRFTAEFIGETNIFEGTVVDDHADYAIIQCPELDVPVRIDHGLGGPTERNLWLSIRPEDIDLYKEKPESMGDYNWAQGTVEEIAYLGSFAIYHVKLANGRIVKSQVPAPYWYVRNITPPTWEETVYINWPENQPTPLLR